MVAFIQLCFYNPDRKAEREVFKMTFGEKLKGLRKEKGYSQEEMAGLLEVSRHEPVIIRLNQEKPINWGFALIQS